jgi:hypothetical protein
MKQIVVCSFWVHRPDEFPVPPNPDYLSMLKVLQDSCTRSGFGHIVLTDHATQPKITGTGIVSYAYDLPRNLMRAATEAHAQWLADPQLRFVNTLFVGADCLIRRDFRAELPAGDIAIAFMRDHKRWKINNGFVYVPAASRAKVAPLFRSIANDTSEEMFDDMLAVERALSPMPTDYGVHERHGLKVNFLPLLKWNRYMAVCKQTPNPLADAATDAAVLHFMGGHDNGKRLYFQWAKAHGFA